MAVNHGQKQADQNKASGKRQHHSVKCHILSPLTEISKIQSQFIMEIPCLKESYDIRQKYETGGYFLID
jgi:hypothetical protein